MKNDLKSNNVWFQDLGVIDYKKAWDYQQELLSKVVATKRGNRKLPEEQKIPQDHYLLFCEHPPVYTLGKSGSLAHLLLNEQELKDNGLQFYKINRGGDITHHGPGQLVGYPIFDLDEFFTDVHRYVRYLEEVIIRTIGDYGVSGTRMDKFTGVWIDDPQSPIKRKICAIGVHLSRWVTMHGFAFNIQNDLELFNHIIPCGINEKDKTVTSLEKELGVSINNQEVKNRVAHHFEQVFNIQLIND
jgi:lipoyl(octanoyl) transferase